MFAPTLDWLYWTIGGVLALVAFVFAWRAVFRDRARGRFRCPKCWYDLTAPEGAAPALPVMCSECGRVTKDARRLRKTRRRWGRVVLAMVMVGVAGVVAAFPGVYRNGWWSVVPTWFIVDTMPLFGYPSPLTDELVRRHGVLPSSGLVGRVHSAASPGRTVSLEDEIYLAKRLLEGMPGARPISERWKNTLGQFLSDYSFQLFPAQVYGNSSRGIDPALTAQLEKLYAIPPEFELRTRPVWPQGVPLWVHVTQRQWWPNMVLRWRLEYQHRPGLWNRLEPQRGIVIRRQNLESKGTLDLLVRMQWSGDEGFDSGAEEFDHQFRSSFSIPYAIGGTIDDVLTPVSDPQLDQLVLMTTVYAEYFNVDDASTRVPATEGIGFGVIIEFIRDGEVKHSQRRWWIGGPRARPSYGRGDFEWIREPPQGRSQTAFPGENWTIRIRSDPETALRVIDADKYWQGEVTIPLTIR